MQEIRNSTTCSRRAFNNYFIWDKRTHDEMHLEHPEVESSEKAELLTYKFSVVMRSNLHADSSSLETPRTAVYREGLDKVMALDWAPLKPEVIWFLIWKKWILNFGKMSILNDSLLTRSAIPLNSSCMYIYMGSVCTMCYHMPLCLLAQPVTNQLTGHMRGGHRST